MYGVQINKETKGATKWGEYPRVDGGFITMEEPFEWFIVRYGFRPDFDPFLFNEITINPDFEDIENWEVHPDYAGGRQYYITYDMEKKTVEEVEQSIKSVEAERNYTIIPQDVVSKLVVNTLAAAIREMRGIKLEQKEKDAIDVLLTKNALIWDNDELSKELLSVFVSGSTPDLETPDWKSQ